MFFSHIHDYADAGTTAERERDDEWNDCRFSFIHFIAAVFAQASERGWRESTWGQSWPRRGFATFIAVAAGCCVLVRIERWIERRARTGNIKFWKATAG
jgi:hypothetical protein